MGQILHGSARTTEAARRAIQNSQESIRAIVGRYSINPKTVAKWKKRTAVSDLRTGPKEIKSTVLTIEEEGIVVAFRTYTLLPLDECFYLKAAALNHAEKEFEVYRQRMKIEGKTQQGTKKLK